MTTWYAIPCRYIFITARLFDENFTVDYIVIVVGAVVIIVV